ncbi:MAG TPA: hypothetical protein VKV73_05790 [Chloroflexota bacterium]|nr:hypothetical protein [Chloroflexota bacterium]
MSAIRESIRLDGRTVSYLEWGTMGTADAVPMVLWHGGNSAAADWQDVAAIRGFLSNEVPSLCPA